jgi:hypothetical protein
MTHIHTEVWPVNNDLLEQQHRFRGVCAVSGLPRPSAAAGVTMGTTETKRSA